VFYQSYPKYLCRKSRLIYLKYSDKLITWNNFIQLIEGAAGCAENPQSWGHQARIFATSIAPIYKYVVDVVHEGETEMMMSHSLIVDFGYSSCLLPRMFIILVYELYFCAIQWVHLFLRLIIFRLKSKIKNTNIELTLSGWVSHPYHGS